MKERPILFSAPMVRAILSGTKTQTRRLLKPQITSGAHDIATIISTADSLAAFVRHHCPYGAPADRLWVRETWADLEVVSRGNFNRKAIYRADDIERYGNEDEYVDVTAAGMRWRPSIHMPRWASRITLEITGVRAERLQAISSDDARAEGVEWDPMGWKDYRHDDRRKSSAAQSYETLWEAINGPASWPANPWVWVVEFKRATP